MYPTFICNHGMFPAHLGKEFLTLYREIREARMKAKITGDKVMDASGKLIGNGTFGKFGSELSFLCDFKMLYTTTLNNQLLLLMLIEQCGLNNLKVISANTDSITVNIQKDSFSLLESLTKRWEEVSLHTMEYTPYNCIIYRDVNNYLSETTDGKVKSKGVFEHHRDWHKNHSAMIVPLALEEYYINKTNPKDFILNHQDIFDFCKAVKGNKSIKYVDRYWDKDKYKDVPLQTRVNRYIVSNDGNKMIKIMPPLVNEDGSLKKDNLAKYRRENPQQLDMFMELPDVLVDKDREFEVEAGYYTTNMNRIESKEVKDYSINYQFYIDECYKIINQIK